MPKWVHSQVGGFIAMIAAAMVFGVMGGLVRYASEIDSLTKAMFRFIIGMAILGALALAGRIRIDFNNHRLLVIRGIMGAFVVSFYYLAIDKLGLAKGSIIFYSFPIFATINSAIFLKEKVALSKWAAILVAFFGLYLTITGGQEISYSFGKYDFVALGGAFGAGIVQAMIKKLRETDSAYSIYFSQSAFGFWGLVLLMIFPLEVMPAPGLKIGGPEMALVVVGIGVSAAAAQLLMTWGYRHVTVSSGALTGTLAPVFCAVVGMLFFDEPIGQQSGIGMVIVLVTCGYVVSRGVKINGRVGVGD